jgi:hypothetical protein
VVAVADALVVGAMSVVVGAVVGSGGGAVVVGNGATVVVGSTVGTVGGGVTGTVVTRSVVVGALVAGAVVVRSVVAGAVVAGFVEPAVGTVGRLSPGSGFVVGVAVPPRVVRRASAIPPPRSATESGTAQSARLRRLGGFAGRRTCVGSDALGSGSGANIIVAAPSLSPTTPPRSSRKSAPPSAGRLAGSFASAAAATLSSRVGASARKSATEGALSSRCMRTSSIAFVETNGNRPVSMRNRITPNE